MAHIQLKKIRHTYDGKTWVLGPLDIEFKRGGCYSLLGPSGCGKTTLLKILSGLISPTEGEVFFDGKDVTKLSTQKRNIAQVFQFPVVYDTMTVYENFAFPLRNHGHSSKEIKKRVDEISRLLGLERELKNPATGLSPHVKQLVSLGRGLVRKDVSAVLFDEPLTVVSPQLKATLRKKLKDIHDELDLTFLYVTHDQTEALTFAEEVVVMKDGDVLQKGTPQELFDKPASSFVGYFIGTPGMNFLDYEVRGGRIDPIEMAPFVKDLREDKKGLLGIRPQHIKLNLDPCLLNDWVWKVKKIDFLGPGQLVSIEQGNFSLKVTLPSERRVHLGDRVGVDFPDNKVSLFSGEKW